MGGKPRNSSIWADWLRPRPPAPEKHGCHRRQIPLESHSSTHTISVSSNASSAWLAPNHAGLSHTLLSTPPTKYCLDCFARKVLALHFFLLVTALDVSVSDSQRERNHGIPSGHHESFAVITILYPFTWKYIPEEAMEEQVGLGVSSRLRS